MLAGISDPAVALALDDALFHRVIAAQATSKSKPDLPYEDPNSWVLPSEPSDWAERARAIRARNQRPH